MASAVDLHEGEVTRGLDPSVLLTVGLEGGELSALELLLARPLKLVGPSLVAEPVANEISIAGVDEHGNLLQNARHKEVERLHPVTIEQEVAVDVKVAAVVAIDRLNTKGLHNILLVQVLVDGGKARVAEAASLAVNANIVRVAARLLVGANHLVVAVDGGGDAAQPALALVAAGNHGLAPGQGVVHALALTLVKDSIVTTITAGHGAVVGVLRIRISQAIADEDGLQVDVAVLVGQNLRGEDGNVVASIRLASNVEVLLGVLRELLEEQGQERIDVLAGSTSVAD